MNVFNRWYQCFIQPAPLDEFVNYDEYWLKRLDSNDLPRLMPRYHIIADRIPDGSSVLDIGCGSGDFIQHLISTKPKCNVVGVDISDAAISRLVKMGIQAKTINPEIPLDKQFDQIFDYVVMMEVIEHIHDAETITRQASLLARKRIFITLPNVGFIMHRIRLGLFGRFPVTNIRCHMKEHIRFWTVIDFTEWSERLNLALFDVIPQVGSDESLLIRTLAKNVPSLFSKSVIYELIPNCSSMTEETID